MDTEYILSCAFELAETSPVENAVLWSPRGAYWDVRNRVDNDLDLPQHYLSNTARAALEQASLPQQYCFALQGMAELDFALKAFSERAEHLVQTKAQHDLGVGTLPVHGLLPEIDELQGLSLVTQPSDISEGLVRNMLDRLCAHQAHRWAQDLQLMAQAAHWHQADDGLSFQRLLLQNEVPGAAHHNASELIQAAAAARQKHLERLQVEQRTLHGKARAAIKKATRLFQSLGKERNLKLFVSGAEVTLAHPDSVFKFVLKPLKVQGWLLDRTMAGRSHTPYELSLFTKDDVFLANLCVYFNDTPVLDQLLALTLFVESGDEMKILEKANWFGTNDWTEAKTKAVLTRHPELARKIPYQRTDDEKTETRGRRVLVNPEFTARQNHWEPFKGRVEQWVKTWMEPATLAAHQLAMTLPQVAPQVRQAMQLQRDLSNAERVAATQQLRLAA